VRRGITYGKANVGALLHLNELACKRKGFWQCSTMYQRSIAVFALGLLLAGCGKSGVDKEAVQEKPAVNASTNVAAPEEDMGPVLAELTQVVRKFSAEQRRVPQSLDELVSAGYLKQQPTPPAGKQFFIDVKALTVGVK
jgi:hypothetical protein